MTTSQQYCTFFLDGSLFGVKVDQVQEVIRFQEMTAVPLAPSVVEGMINLRGQIVLAIDLRKRLAFRPRAHDDLPLNVVVRTSDGAVSLLVDEIGDVVDAQESTFERPPETLPPGARGMILGIHKLDGKLLHVLDTAAACQLQVQAASAGSRGK